MGKGDNQRSNKEAKKPKKDKVEKKTVTTPSTRTEVPVVAKKPTKG